RSWGVYWRRAEGSLHGADHHSRGTHASRIHLGGMSMKTAKRGTRIPRAQTAEWQGRRGARARLRCAALSCAALGALIAAPTALAGTTSYAVGKPLCKAPKPGYSACLSERKILVKKGTHGARAFKPGAGATTSSPSPNAQTIGPAGGITPFDLATAYGFNSLTSASSQTVAIVDAFDD